MKLHLYCVCDDIAGVSLAGVRGVNGAAVRAVEHNGLTALVSELEMDAAAEVTAENARAHNRVNTLALALATPLPFRFGSCVTEERLADYVKSHEKALREALARVRGCVEMSVKLMWDAASDPRRKDEAEQQASESRNASSPPPPSAGSGTAFLLSKQREISGDAAARARAAEVAAALNARVLDVVRDARVTVLPSPALVVRAAHLVERARLEEYRARLRAMEAERAGALIFLTSGAWPPYSFSDLGSSQVFKV